MCAAYKYKGQRVPYSILAGSLVKTVSGGETTEMLDVCKTKCLLSFLCFEGAVLDICFKAQSY